MRPSMSRSIRLAQMNRRAGGRWRIHSLRERRPVETSRHCRSFLHFVDIGLANASLGIARYFQEARSMFDAP